jgi:hypothetical protein
VANVGRRAVEELEEGAEDSVGSGGEAAFQRGGERCLRAGKPVVALYGRSGSATPPRSMELV